MTSSENNASLPEKSAEQNEAPQETFLQYFRRNYRFDPLRDLAMLSLSRCDERGPVPTHAAQLSPDDALDILFGSQRSDEPREDS